MGENPEETPLGDQVPGYLEPYHRYVHLCALNYLFHTRFTVRTPSIDDDKKILSNIHIAYKKMRKSLPWKTWFVWLLSYLEDVEYVDFEPVLGPRGYEKVKNIQRKSSKVIFNPNIMMVLFKPIDAAGKTKYRDAMKEYRECITINYHRIEVVEGFHFIIVTKPGVSMLWVVFIVLCIYGGWSVYAFLKDDVVGGYTAAGGLATTLAALYGVWLELRKTQTEQRNKRAV